MANNQIYPYSGVVETIISDFNNETGTIAFRATFPNPDRILRHGETGNILMPVHLKKALIIPQKATFEVLEKKYVFVVHEDGKIEQREIQISGEIPHFFILKEGLKENEKVLIEGLRKVKNGEHISTKMISFSELVRELQNIHAE